MRNKLFLQCGVLAPVGYVADEIISNERREHT